MDCPVCCPLSSSFVTHWADRVDRRVRQMTKWKVNELIKKKWTSILSMETQSVYKVLLPALMRSSPSFRWKSFTRDQLVGLAKYLAEGAPESLCGLSNNHFLAVPWCCGETKRIHDHGVSCRTCMSVVCDLCDTVL